MRLHVLFQRLGREGRREGGRKKSLKKQKNSDRLNCESALEFSRSDSPNDNERKASNGGRERPSFRSHTLRRRGRRTHGRTFRAAGKKTQGSAEVSEGFWKLGGPANPQRLKRKREGGYLAEKRGQGHRKGQWLLHRARNHTTSTPTHPLHGFQD